MKAIRNSAGFTLIELLVVVAIIGILAAIAIPQFALYRQRGFDARSQSDLRNAATAEEAAFATNNTYVTCDEATCVDPVTGIGFKASKDVTLSMVDNTGSFTGTSQHAQGAITWTYDSTAGGIQ